MNKCSIGGMHIATQWVIIRRIRSSDN